MRPLHLSNYLKSVARRIAKSTKPDKNKVLATLHRIVSTLEGEEEVMYLSADPSVDAPEDLDVEAALQKVIKIISENGGTVADHTSDGIWIVPTDQNMVWEAIWDMQRGTWGGDVMELMNLFTLEGVDDPRPPSRRDSM